MAIRVGEIALGAVRYSFDAPYCGCASLPLHAARAAMVPTTEAVMAAEAAGFLAAEPGKHDKAMLLAVVEALVERPGRVGELLETGRALAHHLGTQIEALDRILRAIGAGARGKTLRALLGEIAQRALHRRPVLFLFGSELEPGMERGDTCVTEGRDVFGIRAPALHALKIVRALLCIGKRSAGDRKRGRAGKNRSSTWPPPMAFPDATK